MSLFALVLSVPKGQEQASGGVDGLSTSQQQPGTSTTVQSMDLVTITVVSPSPEKSAICAKALQIWSDEEL